jgi:hypothetical protein
LKSSELSSAPISNSGETAFPVTDSPALASELRVGVVNSEGTGATLNALPSVFHPSRSPSFANSNSSLGSRNLEGGLHGVPVSTSWPPLVSADTATSPNAGSTPMLESETYLTGIACPRSISITLITDDAVLNGRQVAQYSG